MGVACELEGATLERGDDRVCAGVRGDERDGEALEARVRERDAGCADVHGLFARHAHQGEREGAQAREAAKDIREGVLRSMD